MPRKCTACMAAIDCSSARGSARPMSSIAMRTRRRAMYMRSSPASSMRASQYSAASASLDRTDLCSAEIRLKCSSPRFVVEQHLALQGVLRPPARSSSPSARRGRRRFQRVVGRARVAVRVDRDLLQQVVGAPRAPAPCSAALQQRRRSPARSARAARRPCERESSAEITSNDGFSVVAPIRMMSPRSTYGRNASCCALLKR